MRDIEIEKKNARQVENPNGQFMQKQKQKKKRHVRLKTQKGGLGKSQGQRKKRKEARQAENPKGQSRQKLGPKKRKEKGKIQAN